MIVCIDTNVVLRALCGGNPCQPILEAWIEGRVTWAVSTEILLEYEEVVTRLSGAPRWRKLARLMDLVELTEGNLRRVTPSFHFGVVSADPDDNKFADCAIAAGADFVITEDAHFAVLAEAGFKAKAIAPQDFIARILPTV